MLVNCPKCGFSQPQDQYCAKCGVDMQSFRAKPEPVQKRLVANPVFLIGVVFVLVFSGALYIIREQRSQEITRRLDYLKNGPVYAESLPGREESAVNQPSTEIAANREAASVDDTPPPPPPGMVSANNSAAAVSSTAATMAANVAARADAPVESATTDANEAAMTKPIAVRAHYALAPRAKLMRMMEASRSQSQVLDFGEFQMGTLRNIKSYLDTVDVMESVQRKYDSATGEQIWMVGDRNVDAQLGLTTRLALRGMDNGNLRGEIELLRNFHESNDLSQNVVSKAFGPGEFVVPDDAGLIVVLNLPRVPQYDESIHTPTQFLRIFRMPDFKQKQSEFILLVDFE